MFDKEQENFKSLESIFAEHTRQIVFWTGAGLSTPASLPTWKTLRDLLIERADKLLSEVTYSGNDVDHKRALIQLAKCEPDFWKSFSHIHDVLGETTYAESIRTIFRPAERCLIPPVYSDLLSLKPTGIITTNVDRLISRAVAESDHTVSPVPLDFTGFDCKDYLYALNGTRFFVLHLHGIFEKRDSWVFRKEELGKLLTETAYHSFLQTCFLSKSIIFVGASVDDVSITTHLNKHKGLDTTPHFWITNDRTQSTRLFCEKYNILPIYYSPDNNHSELAELFNLLKSFRPEDTQINRPVAPLSPTTNMSMRNFEDIPLDTLPLNELRKVLNRKVQTILSSETSSSYELYRAFRQKYSKYIHFSWHVDPPENQLFDFELTEEIDDGAFGRVFMAKDKQKHTVAVKLLKEDVMRKDDWLQAFRRGVRAMQILNERQIAGMVKYISASEIPTFVAMEYVDGINLKTAIDNQQFKDWRDILRLLCDISSIIAKAHGLPERVLHRDIRPANIMLRGFDYDAQNWSVCILDFDLAFHKGASEVSIEHSSDTNGFLAPEQLDSQSRFTTRSALVDSYGVGMLFYYVVSRKLPKPEQSQHADWLTTLRVHVSSKACADWVSLPFRMARLIDQCTRFNQSQRLDMTQIHGTISALRRVYLDDRSVIDGDLLAEELATRIAMQLEAVDRLSWNPDTFEAKIERRSGELIIIRSSDNIINILISWQNDGSVRFEEAKKQIVDCANSAITRFARQGFNDVKSTLGGNNALVDVIIDTKRVTLHMNAICDLVKSVRLAPKAY